LRSGKPLGARGVVLAELAGCTSELLDYDDAGRVVRCCSPSCEIRARTASQNKATEALSNKGPREGEAGAYGSKDQNHRAELSGSDQNPNEDDLANVANECPGPNGEEGAKQCRSKKAEQHDRCGECEEDAHLLLRGENTARIGCNDGQEERVAGSKNKAQPNTLLFPFEPRLGIGKPCDCCEEREDACQSDDRRRQGARE